MPTNFHPADQANPYADYTVQQMYDFISGYTLTRDPGALFEYSNFGVGLLGHALSASCGQTYEEMERKRVWEPLKMTRTAITLTPWMSKHLARGHDDKGAVVKNWDVPTFAGAGAIRSTTVDMLKFASANLHPERGRLQEAMAFAHEARSSAGGPNTSIGLNWLIAKRPTSSIIWHNGGTGGYRTFLGLDPAKRTAVVVMTNSGGAGADDIGMHLLDPSIPLTPKPVPPKQHVAIELASDVMARYVGVYQLAPQFAITVTLTNGTLIAQATGQGALRLWPETETDFFFKEVDAQITFVRDSQGASTQLNLHQNGVNQPAKKVGTP
jgi:CubicO group peptidase (beta-lactamase class C family)